MKITFCFVPIDALKTSSRFFGYEWMVPFPGGSVIMVVGFLNRRSQPYSKSDDPKTLTHMCPKTEFRSVVHVRPL